jgi:putative heme transporter
VVAAVFGFVLPRVGSYGRLWPSVAAMGWLAALVVAGLGALNLVSSWLAITAVLPAVRLRHAAAANLGSTAVANSLPAGGALAVGVSWAMLASCGVSRAQYARYAVLSGVWNVAVRLALPVLGVCVLALAGGATGPLLVAGLVGLGVLLAAAAGLGVALRRPARRARLGRVLAGRTGRITLSTAASHLSLWLVLLACVRAAGLSQSQVSWQLSLAAFAVVRLASALPVTPGGLGVVELGLTGMLVGGLPGPLAAGPAVAQVTAAVLLFRAVTWLAPIPLGLGAYLLWLRGIRRSAGARGTTATPVPAG